MSEAYDNLALRTEAPSSIDALNRLAWEHRKIHAILGMMTELGEFSDPFKKFIYYGKPIDRTNAIEELGDLLWYVAIAANALNTTISEVQRVNIEKLSKRYPEKFTEFLAVNRDLDAERETLEGAT
jgi:NTP pyrophosphatase (non-canonical NTP hydrolase)